VSPRLPQSRQTGAEPATSAARQGCPEDGSTQPRGIASRAHANTIRVTQRIQDHHMNMFQLVKPEPTRGLEPRTYRLQDSFSMWTMASISDFTVYSDRSDGSSGTVGREFVSQPVSCQQPRFRPLERSDHPVAVETGKIKSWVTLKRDARVGVRLTGPASNERPTCPWSDQ